MTTNQAIEELLPRLCQELRGQVRWLFYRYHIPEFPEAAAIYFV